MRNELPMAERPSVKMAYYGAKSLSNAELLSLIVGNGTKASLELSDKIISHANENIGSLGIAEVCELAEVYGVGGAKASAIVAAVELGRRVSMDATGYKERVDSSETVARLVRAKYAPPGEKREHFIMFCLNTKLQIESEHLISLGGLDSAPVHPREVFSPAVRRSAAAVIVAHNHPSGDTTPSPQDIEVTERLKNAAEVLGIKLLDHVIVGDSNFTSLKSEGYF